MCNECGSQNLPCDCTRFYQTWDLAVARRFALRVLSEEEDPTDSNTAIKLAELIKKATE